jgi:hypothetical protein
MSGSADPVYTGVFIVLPSDEWPGTYTYELIAGNN